MHQAKTIIKKLGSSLTYTGLVMDRMHLLVWTLHQTRGPVGHLISSEYHLKCVFYLFPFCQTKTKKIKIKILNITQESLYCHFCLFTNYDFCFQKTITAMETVSRELYKHNASIWYGHYPLSVTTDPHHLRKLIS